MVKIYSKPHMDYAKEYDQYWSSTDRIGEKSADLGSVADLILMTCGSNKVLDIGSGEGDLVRELLKRGADAFGIDVSQTVVDRSNQKVAGRFIQGSILELPFEDGVFHSIVSTDCMEHLAPEDVPQALAEIYRVAGCNVFLQLATTQDRDDHWHLTVQGRAWWEQRCFESGFRKHPAYYTLNDYASLNRDNWQIYILLEKIPPRALSDYPLVSLNEERGLHMDMTRDTGERSDAHIIRYQWACNYVKPGDRVLDAACGLGYGGHVVRYLTHAAKVVGVDGSEYAIDYATKSFPSSADSAEYRLGFLPDALSEFADGSFDVIISFETLEHVEDPKQLLQEFFRVLTPGGRVIVSVPNDWSDETGEDPNPYHLHVYDWVRLKSELSAHFIVEDAYAQTASQCKVPANGGLWERRPRSLKQAELSENSPEDCEWWLMTAMKSPLESTQPYQEKVFANIATSEHPSIRYTDFFQNPWLMYAMVNFSHRLKSPFALEALADRVLESMPCSSNDYAAALCVKAYSALEHRLANISAIEDINLKIDEIIALPCKDAMSLRWKVSLLSVKGKLLQATGSMDKAKDAFIACAGIDVREFGIHLATKTTEAFYLAGRIALTLGNQTESRLYWQRGIEYGNVLLSVSLDDVLINQEFPNLFNHGDGIREYTVGWDNIARCANGIHLLNIGRNFDYVALDSCHQTEYDGVTKDLIKIRKNLDERTGLLEQNDKELLARTRELVETRKILIERTAQLERVSADLIERTQDLVDTRQLLIERTERLEMLLDSKGN